MTSAPPHPPPASPAQPRVVDGVWRCPENPFALAAEEINQSLHSCFESRAALHADRIALGDGDAHWTFAELDRAANKIARSILARLGRGREPSVVLVDKSLAHVAALIGALKSGRILAPLDPDDPPARLRQIVADARPEIILAHGSTLALAREIAGAVPLLDVDEALADAAPARSPAVFAPPDAPAYIIHTSGSTGVPKGVVQSHRNFLWTLRQTHLLHALVPDDRVAHLASVGFLLSLTSLLQGLFAGASVQLYDAKREPMAEIARRMVGDGVTYLHAVPTPIRQIALALGPGGRLPALRLVRFVGEPLKRSDLEMIERITPEGCVFSNGYGSTEMNVVRAFLWTRGERPEVPPAAIGYGFEGIAVHICDAEGRELPVGQAGEMALRSRHLSLGYWRRPEETAAAFFDSPSGGGERVFRTGDMGRLAPDGLLEHMGRVDHQVKVRGVRVELAEVESALLDAPGVREAAVALRRFSENDERLVAYVVGEPGAAPTASVLRRRLAEALPPAMIPSAFVFLASLPQTGTGKLDRGALPVPGGDRPTLDANYLAPRDPVEATMRDVWEETLGVRPVGVRDDFFELGGDSIRAMQATRAMSEALGVEIAPARMAASPTIEALAAGVNRIPTGERGYAVELCPGGEGPPLCVVEAEQSGLYAYRALLPLLGEGRPIFGFAPGGEGGRPTMYPSIADAAERFILSIKALQPEGPYHLLGFCHGALIAHEAARLLMERGERIARLIMIEPPMMGRHARWAWNLIDAAGRVTGGSPKATARRYLSIHPQLHKIEIMARRRYRLLNPLAWFTSPWRLGKVLAYEDPWLPDDSGGEAAAAPEAREEGAEGSKGRLAFRHYIEPVRVHFPARYEGRMLLIGAERSQMIGASLDLWVRRWKRVNPGGVEAVIIPGDHHSIFIRPHVTRLAEVIRDWLEADAESPTEAER